MNFFTVAERIQKEIQALPVEGVGYQSLETRQQSSVQISNIIQGAADDLDESGKARIQQEFEGFGPLESLFIDESVTEIMINSPKDIWFERNGSLHLLADSFISDLTFENFQNRLCEESRIQLSLEKPYSDGRFRNFRVHMVSSPVTTSPVITLRRQRNNPWTLEQLQAEGWSDSEGITILKRWIREKKTFLIVGETGSGKTSVLSSCLQALPACERALVLEDTSEIPLPNSASAKMLTRNDCHSILPEISLTDLVRQSLRMRPDRLVIGEVRGGEAKDLMLALSTGHEGSLGTLHASSAHQALFRLEMLVQLGSPQWSLETIRRLMKLSLHGLAVVGRDQDKKRKLISLNEISSVESTGLLLDCVFENPSFRKSIV